MTTTIVPISRVIGQTVLRAARQAFPAAAAAAPPASSTTLTDDCVTPTDRKEIIDFPPSFVIQKSKFAGTDYQSNIAFLLAKIVRKRPSDIASVIVEELRKGQTTQPDHKICDSMIHSVEASGNGFLNINLGGRWMLKKASEIALTINRQSATKLTTISASDMPSVQSKTAKSQSRMTDAKQRVLIDYASPNMCKPLHVGHLRSAIIGDSLARILEFQGYQVDRVSHVGDWGTPMAMVLQYLRQSSDDSYAWTHTCDPLLPKIKQHSQKQKQLLPIDAEELGRVYIKAKQKFDKDDHFRSQVHASVQALQRSTSIDDLNVGSLRHTWQIVCEASRQSFQNLFDKLEVRGLEERGESAYSHLLPTVVSDLKQESRRQKKAHPCNERMLSVHESKGAVCVFLEGAHNPPTVIQKSDGSYLYATTDLAALRSRLNEGYKRVLYVVDHAQGLHFQHIFEISRRAGWFPKDRDVDVKHVEFGLILGADGKKMSSRQGGTPLLVDLIQQAYDSALKHTLMREKEKVSRASSKSLENNDCDMRIENDVDITGVETSSATKQQHNIANVLATGALRFFDLAHAPTTDYAFSAESLLGPTGSKGKNCVRVLYAHSRLSQILKIANCEDNNEKTVEGGEALSEGYLELSDDLTDLERELLLHITSFPDVVERCSELYRVNLLCEHIDSMASCINRFYQEERIRNHPRSKLRLELCRSARTVLGTGLFLIGVKTLDFV